MRSFLLILFLIAGFRTYSYDLKHLRSLLYESASNKEKAEVLYKEMKVVEETEDAIWNGFRAMSEMMMCNHVGNPYSKLSHFKAGKELLENSIARANSNVELRFFRFSVQTNVPSILGYSGNIPSDKLFLISYLKENSSNVYRDQDLYSKIKNYMLQCSDCTQMERETIQKY